MKRAVVRTYRELLAWRKAMDMVLAVYRLSEMFPAREGFGLTSQLRRAAVSVPSNLAEGQSRGSTREFLHHLYIARGSLAEAETQLLVALRLEYMTKKQLQDCWDLMQEVGRLLNGLINSLGRNRMGRSTDH